MPTQLPEADPLFPHIWWQRWDSSHWRIAKITSSESSQVEEIARTLSRSDRTFVCSILICCCVLCSDSLIFLCLFVSFVQAFSLTLFLKTTLGSMSKGTRKNAVPTEGGEGEARSSVISSEPGSEMMTMFKVLLEEQRKAELAREEARRQEEERKEEARRQDEERRETIRVEREIEATRRQLEEQTALEARQYEQQMALMKIQAEIGEKASKMHREEQSTARKRDRALASISNLRDGEDLEEFLLTAERRMRAADIRQGEWIAVIDSKLTGKLASAWQDICVTVVEYQEAKDRLLKVCGYTPRLAADVFF